MCLCVLVLLCFVCLCVRCECMLAVGDCVWCMNATGFVWLCVCVFVCMCVFWLGCGVCGVSGWVGGSVYRVCRSRILSLSLYIYICIYS